MARKLWLGLMLAMVGLFTLGTNVSRTVGVSLSIPALSVLNFPEQGLSGQEILLQFRLEDLAPHGLLIPFEVKSNVSWAVTAQLLSKERVDMVVQVLDGPEVMVTTEELPILSGRPGKHEVYLVVKFSPAVATTGQLTLVLRVAGGAEARARMGERG